MRASFRRAASLAAALAVALTATGLVVSARPAAASACPPPGGVGMPKVRPPAGDFAFVGHGWGHGVGMSQYGAQGAARLGCSAAEILKAYFRGASPGRTSGTQDIVVGLFPNSPHARLRHQVAVSQLSGRPITWVVVHPNGVRRTIRPRQQSGATWTVHSLADGRLELKRGAKRIWRGGTQGSALHARHNGRIVRVAANATHYRWGTLRFTSRASGGRGMYVTLRLPSIERYLRGLAEVPSTWPRAALRAQAIVARSYAKISRDSGSRWGSCLCHLYDSVYDQAYRGWDKEAETVGGIHYGARWADAVAATARTVLLYGGRVVRGYYSSSHGGHTASSHSVWGGEVGYLQPVDDSRWDRASDNPNKAWAASLSAAQLGRRFGVGTALYVTLPKPRGGGGRIGNPSAGYGGFVIQGTKGAKRVSGEAARSILGLKSALFTVRSPQGVPLVGDWDGDGRSEPGWHRSGVFSLRVDGRARRFRFGRKGDTPLVGDWTGDGRDTIGVRRGRTWILRNRNSAGPASRRFRWGAPDAQPVVGNWDGRGRDGIGVRHGNRWALRNRLSASGRVHRFLYGRTSQRAVVGDWNGDGRDTLGLYRDGRWWLRNTFGRGKPDRLFRFGGPRHRPVVGDWDRDGRDTIGSVRRNGWRLRNANTAGRPDRRLNYGG